MRKVKNENVIEITEDVKIGKGIILEKGDKIQVIEGRESSITIEIDYDPEEAIPKIDSKFNVSVKPIRDPNADVPGTMAQLYANITGRKENIIGWLVYCGYEDIKFQYPELF